MKFLNQKNLKIGVLKTDGIGDAILASPFFFELKKSFKSSKIIGILSYSGAEVLEDLGVFDYIIKINPLWLSYKKKNFFKRVFSAYEVLKKINKEKFDMLIGLRYQDRLSSLILSLSNAKLKIGYDVKGMGFNVNIKIPIPDKKVHESYKHFEILKILGFKPNLKNFKLGFSLNKEDEKNIKKFLKNKKIKDYIVIHPVSGHISKDWGIENYKELIKRLSLKHKIIVVGAKEDKNIYELKGKNVYNVAGFFSIKEVGALIKYSRFVLGNDSAITHIASVFNKPSLTIFSGTVFYEAWRPLGKKSFVLAKNVSCRGCELLVCPKENHDCMDFSVDVIEKLVINIINNKQKDKIMVLK